MRYYILLYIKYADWYQITIVNPEIRKMISIDAITFHKNSLTDIQLEYEMKSFNIINGKLIRLAETNHNINVIFMSNDIDTYTTFHNEYFSILDL